MQKADAPPDGMKERIDGRFCGIPYGLPMSKDARTNSSAVVTKDQKDAKEARLAFRILSREVQEQRMAEAGVLPGYVARRDSSCYRAPSSDPGADGACRTSALW